MGSWFLLTLVLENPDPAHTSNWRCLIRPRIQIFYTLVFHITRISFLTLMFFCRINEIPPHYLGAEGRINDCASWSTEDCGNI